MIPSADAKPILSILLITYQHERYIQQAIESIFAQDFAGPIELIIADDASTDNTLDIIKKFDGIDARFRFHFLEPKGNLGITKNYQRGFQACHGDFVAVLEGDDYWSHPEKLKRQIAFLDAHPECVMCAVNCFLENSSVNSFKPRGVVGDHFSLLTSADLIADNIISNFSTCMYRLSALQTLPPTLFELRAYDWIVHIAMGLHGLLGYIHEPMSVYRLHTHGTWTKIPHSERLKRQLEMLPSYDKVTEFMFHDNFVLLKREIQLDFLLLRFKLVCFTVLSTLTKPVKQYLRKKHMHSA